MKAKFMGQLKRSILGAPDTDKLLIEAKKLADADQLDTAFYAIFYPDLSDLSEEKLIRHWAHSGKKEGRLANPNAFFMAKGVTDYQSGDEQRLDMGFYTSYYPDLTNRFAHVYDAYLHFIKHGKAENRMPSLKDWMLHKGLVAKDYSATLLADLLAFAVQQQNLPAVLDTVSGDKVHLFAFYESPELNAKAYVKLAEPLLLGKKHPQAVSLLSASIAIYATGRAYELLGNVQLEHKESQLALALYQQAATFEDASEWVYRNAVTILLGLARYDEALVWINRLHQQLPEKKLLLSLLDTFAENYFNHSMRFAQVEVLTNNRQGVLSLFNVYGEQVSSTYAQAFGAAKSLKALNGERILIVGDFHVPQCVRYRIDQKVEQLELMGKTVTTVDWTQLKTNWNALYFHDIIIFYRVPSVPWVLKALCQVNALGKLSIYEIDDLLFEPDYPPAIETYGGYVDMNTYHELVKGMALFNTAIRYARVAMASTMPLLEALEPLVMDKTGILHRNGLDSLNTFAVADHTNKQTIDIFYGSGTQAHNSDFIEQVLPALERILSEYAQVRLVIAGYLNLPVEFVQRFANQLKQVPPVKKVQNYWTLLAQADISIAVLNEDRITNAKSELKWFEAACFAIPSVLSSTANYRDVICHGEDAFLVENSEEWYEALSLLIQQPDLRQQMGQQAQVRVKHEYSLATLGQQLVDNLDELVHDYNKLNKPRKKLLIVNVFFSPQSIGGATRVVEDNVDLLIEQYADEYDISIFTADAEQRDMAHRLSAHQYQGVNVYRVTTLFREHMDWHPKDEQMYQLFSEFLQNEQPDLVHFHCVQRLTASVVEATRDAETPYLVTVHDAWWLSDYQFLVDESGKVYPEGHPDPYEMLPTPNGVSFDESIERKQYLKGLLKEARKVLVVSESFADIYRKNGITNVQVTKNGLSSKKAWLPKQTAYTEKVVCALIGGMSAHKGYDILKEAIMEAQPKHCCFLFVDHAKEAGYRAEEQWGEVEVTFIGRVKQGAIVSLYRQIDVLFAPSIWPESFGLVTREAAACGCWVVASNMGGIGEDVVEDETGFVIEPSVAALVAVLQRLDENAVRFKGLAAQSGFRSVAKQVEEIINCYEVVIHG